MLSIGDLDMVYCSKCGQQIIDDAYFCFKCGARTPVGKAANAAYPQDELRDAFYRVGIELEKAFTLAANETHQAFKRVSEDLQKKPSASSASASQDTLTCPKCAAKSPAGSIFCNNCGAKLTPAEESQSGA